MSANDSWICQGRQEHGWFGDGTCDGSPTGSGGVPDSDQAVADRLMKAAQAAYDHYPRDCSHLVNMVLRELVNPNEPYLTANSLMASVARRDSGWREVTMQEASNLANKGKVVIAGHAERSGNGHVVVVVPGPMRRDGGFDYHGRPLQPTGMFPPAVSGSLGGWPGAMSRGEKTVRDAWGPQAWRYVTFWVRQ